MKTIFQTVLIINNSESVELFMKIIAQGSAICIHVIARGCVIIEIEDHPLMHKLWDSFTDHLGLNDCGLICGNWRDCWLAIRECYKEE
jgi:hypothetical protein